MPFAAADYLDLSETEHAGLFLPEEPVWAALARIAEHLAELLDRVGPTTQGASVDPRAFVGEGVRLGLGVVVEANAVIKGPAWIGPGTIVRSGAYVRENVLVGEGCVLGNSCEFKNCLLFNCCEVPHFNYVGDSILGYRAHLGAGVVCSNVRLDRATVKVREGEGFLDTGLRKFGAVVGDRAEIGCNSVLSPGAVLGRECLVYPLTSWSGVLPARHLARQRAETLVVARR
jgi:NDP-sugar pyrophosphorylase family protein